MKESSYHLYTITAALEGTANLLKTIEVMTIFLKFMDNIQRWYYLFIGSYLRTSMCGVFSRTISDDIYFTL